MIACFSKNVSCCVSRWLLLGFGMLLAGLLVSGCSSSGGTSDSRLPSDPVNKRMELTLEAYRSYQGTDPLGQVVVPPGLDAKAASSSSHPAKNMIDNQPQTYWESDDDLDGLSFTLYFGAVDMDEDMFGFVVDTSCLEKGDYRAIQLVDLSVYEERLPEFVEKRSPEDNIHIPGEDVFVRNDERIRLALENKAARQVFFLKRESINPDERNRLVVNARITGWYPGNDDETCLSEFHPFLQNRGGTD